MNNRNNINNNIINGSTKSNNKLSESDEIYVKSLLDSAYSYATSNPSLALSLTLEAVRLKQGEAAIFQHMDKAREKFGMKPHGLGERILELQQQQQAQINSNNSSNNSNNNNTTKPSKPKTPINGNNNNTHINGDMDSSNLELDPQSIDPSNYQNSRIHIEQIDEAEEFVEAIDEKFNKLSVSNTDPINLTNLNLGRTSSGNSTFKLSTHTPVHRNISPYSRSPTNPLNNNDSTKTHSRKRSSDTNRARPQSGSNSPVINNNNNSNSPSFPQFNNPFSATPNPFGYNSVPPNNINSKTNNNVNNINNSSQSINNSSNSFLSSSGILFEPGSSMNLNRNETTDLSLDALTMHDDDEFEEKKVVHNPFIVDSTNNNNNNTQANNKVEDDSDAAVSVLVTAGKENVLHEAFADEENNVVCPLCNGLLPKARFNNHINFWCQTLQD